MTLCWPTWCFYTWAEKQQQTLACLVQMLSLISVAAISLSDCDVENWRWTWPDFLSLSISHSVFFCPQVRNSSTLLFSSLITRIFGVKKGKDEHSKKNRSALPVQVHCHVHQCTMMLTLEWGIYVQIQQIKCNAFEERRYCQLIEVLPLIST